MVVLSFSCALDWDWKPIHSKAVIYMISGHSGVLILMQVTTFIFGLVRRLKQKIKWFKANKVEYLKSTKSARKFKGGDDETYGPYGI